MSARAGSQRHSIYQVIDALKENYIVLRMSRLIPSLGGDKSDEYSVLIDLTILGDGFTQHGDVDVEIEDKP